MSDMASRYSGPVVVGTGGARPMARAGRKTGAGKVYDEKFLQDLIYDHPGVIPMNDIEPAFTPLVSVCKELETPSGSLDNLWISPEGALVLGECKLLTSSQSRREVVVQALDYARGVSGWSFEQLEQQAALARKDSSFKLWSLVANGSDLGEAQFHDAVQRRLDTGQVMVLIVGDGIREGAKVLTDYLQLHAGFHAGLALVDLSVWEGSDGSLIVVPCIPMRTVLVERGIVTIAQGGNVKIDPPVQSGPVGPQKPHTASETEFYEQLRTKRPELVEPLRAFVPHLRQAGVTPEFRNSLVLRCAPSPDVSGSAGFVESSGYVWLGDSFSIARRVGNEAAARHYLEAVAAAVGGTARVTTHDASLGVAGPQGRTVTISELLPVQDKWLSALRTFTTELNESVKREDAPR